MTSNSEPILLVDTHAHLDLPPFEGDIETVYRHGHDGVFPSSVTANTFADKHLRLDFTLLPGIDAASSRRVTALADQFERFRAGVAIHPNSCGKADPEDWQEIQRLARAPKVVAVGETGLDLYWDFVPLDLQLDYLEHHIRLARQERLPILIHCRDAQAELMPILRRECTGENPLFGVIHAFSGDAAMALECVELGLHISFAGSVTYRNKKFAPLWEAAAAVPADRLLLETDSPYLAPTPYRGKLERNEPLMTAYVANRLAELRGTTFEAIAAQTTANAQRLFRFRT